jgi:hypothetical protein
MSSLSNDLPPPRVHTSTWLLNFLSALRERIVAAVNGRKLEELL